MKPQTRVLIIIGALILFLGVSFLIFSTRKSGPVQIFHGTVRRDCAPWDGGAFTIQIPVNDEEMIDISIWQSPQILSPAKFLFPDNTMQFGNAILIHTATSSEILTGVVWFEGVSEEKPVEGRFRLKSERGDEFIGQFVAEWNHQIVLCG
jgi:hypothetical protein